MRFGKSWTKPSRAAMLALPFLACLTGCGQTHVEKIAPPPERLTCAAEPAPPAGNSDKEVAGFLVDVLAAGRDCRNALAWVRDWAVRLEVRWPRGRIGGDAGVYRRAPDHWGGGIDSRDAGSTIAAKS